MKTLTLIWNFINSKVFVILLLLLLTLISVGECKRLVDNKRKIEIDKQNIAAKSDSIKVIKKKNGELNFSIDGYLGTIKDLKTVNKDLYDEVKQQSGKILSLNKTVIKLTQDSTDLAKHIDKLQVYIGVLTQMDTNHYQMNWKLPYVFDKNNFFTIKGTTRISVLDFSPLTLRHDSTFLTSFENQIDLTFGQKVENGKVRIFVESKYPGLSAKSLSGVLIDPSTWPGFIKPKKQHWFTGFSVGLSSTAGWNFITQKPSLVVGPSFTYSIYTW